MAAQEIMEREDFRGCVRFHGHVCPGLSLGYRAAHAAMDWLKANRAEDEELVAIVETDACAADAVQVLTGCTFGKGNFVFKDYGKMALTLMSRDSGKGVRVSLKPGAFAPDSEHMALLQKLIRGEATEEERERFNSLHFKRSCDVLEAPLEALFSVRAVETEVPDKARIESSEPCERCGEPTMVSKLVSVDGRRLCRGCAAN
ncbi:FmdE family protein [Desulfoglaeba alkanexedens]|uniref:Formylmethanofuran dehydrogenase n=1 Tax=Desulfoglaeba alkanexedens ALDC TaxID=980445 RepID=A0A4P8L2Z4_9BACT|nr:FmdE family protein [Desulfoglaeba alkanexedens]QCQ22210.1 formylmethanofuran dehydrogenase [Desulfoglaeba alkanexedens ALDC]